MTNPTKNSRLLCVEDVIARIAHNYLEARGLGAIPFDGDVQAFNTFIKLATRTVDDFVQLLGRESPIQKVHPVVDTDDQKHYDAKMKVLRAAVTEAQRIDQNMKVTNRLNEAMKNPTWVGVDEYARRQATNFGQAIQ